MPIVAAHEDGKQHFVVFFLQAQLMSGTNGIETLHLVANQQTRRLDKRIKAHRMSADMWQLFGWSQVLTLEAPRSLSSV